VVEEKGNNVTLRFARPVRFKGTREAPEIEPASVAVLRALALEQNRHERWIFAIGVRPRTDAAFDQQAALGQAFAAVEMLRNLVYRDGAVETVGWKAVSSQPGAGASGFGVLVLVLPEQADSDEDDPPEKKPDDAPKP